MDINKRENHELSIIIEPLDKIINKCKVQPAIFLGQILDKHITSLNLAFLIIMQIELPVFSKYLLFINT